MLLVTRPPDRRGEPAALGRESATLRTTRHLLAIVAVLMLAACGDRATASSPPPLHTASPTEAPAPLPTETPEPPAAAADTASSTPTVAPTSTPTLTPRPTATATPLHPLSVASLRTGAYPGSDPVIEETLPPGSNYDRYIASYVSEGLKIRGLLTVPRGNTPEGGWPVIIFNHGYIPPDEYRTTERYVAYVDGFARSGYIVFRPDYRGHDQSEGQAIGAYFSTAYTIDVLNAVASMQAFEGADPNRIGMWGHSMGGHITLQVMVTTDQVKAGVIWAGLMGSYEDLFKRWWWRRWGCTEGTPCPPPDAEDERSAVIREFEEAYGSVDENPALWDAISPTAHLEEISGPIQLHHGTGDATVEAEFSQNLFDRMTDLDLPVELFLYEGDNHNISGSFGTAMARSIEFFDRQLKP